MYEKAKLIDLVDPRLHEDGVPEKDIMQVLHLAFLCLQPHANLRPPMSEIVAMLTCKVEMAGTPVRPAFLDRKRRNNEKLFHLHNQVIPLPFQNLKANDCPSYLKFQILFYYSSDEFIKCVKGFGHHFSFSMDCSFSLYFYLDAH